MLEEKNTNYMEKSVEWEEESKKTSALKSQIEVYKRQVRLERVFVLAIGSISRLHVAYVDIYSEFSSYILGQGLRHLLTVPLLRYKSCSLS